MLNQGTLTEGERLSTVDLHVLTRLDRFLFILKKDLVFLQNKLP